MSMPVIDSVLRFIEAVFTYEAGTPQLNIVIGACVLTWILVARVFMSMFSSKRGIIAAFFGFALPMVFALLAYASAELYAVPVIEQDWLGSVIPGLSLGFILFLSIILLGRRIWGLTSGVSIFIYLVATAAAVGAYFGAQVTIGVIEFGEEQVEQRDQRMSEDINELL
jgi:hypothetical protein